MWHRFSDSLVSPETGNPLRLVVLKGTVADPDPRFLELAQTKGISRDELCGFVEEGALLSDEDGTWFPIIDGLPFLLPYKTSAHDEAIARFGSRLERVLAGFQPPEGEPVPGEEFVRQSFSEEWKDYRYDGVIWELDYEQHERRFRVEVGIDGARMLEGTFLEIGCGMGITTNDAFKNLSTDCVGVDLSLACMSASRRFRDNPFLHFAQASAFALPFPKRYFEMIYSRGVLHHTYSTEKAFESAARHCAASGTFYLWVYGPGSIKASPLRRLLYLAERIWRPILSRNPNSFLAKCFLGSWGLFYVAYNRMRRSLNPSIQKLDFSRAVHAARDRFTPRYAHRQSVEQVSDWFEQEGFQDWSEVQWRDVPAADHGDFSRNTAVRGVMASAGIERS